jgi:hypothetical protein
VQHGIRTGATSSAQVLRARLLIAKTTKDDVAVHQTQKVLYRQLRRGSALPSLGEFQLEQAKLAEHSKLTLKIHKPDAPPTAEVRPR